MSLVSPCALSLFSTLPAPTLTTAPMEAYPGYLGLLKWSLAQSDGTRPSAPARMSEADRTWLKEAMEALTVDEAKRMKELLDVLRKEDTEDNLDEKLGTFEELEYYVETIDNARGGSVLADSRAPPAPPSGRGPLCASLPLLARASVAPPPRGLQTA